MVGQKNSVKINSICKSSIKKKRAVNAQRTNDKLVSVLSRDLEIQIKTKFAQTKILDIP